MKPYQFYMLLGVTCLNFVQKFCIYVHDIYWSIVFFSPNTLACIQFQFIVGLIEQVVKWNSKLRLLNPESGPGPLTPTPQPHSLESLPRTLAGLTIKLTSLVLHLSGIFVLSMKETIVHVLSTILVVSSDMINQVHFTPSWP